MPRPTRSPASHARLRMGSRSAGHVLHGTRDAKALARSAGTLSDRLRCVNAISERRNRSEVVAGHALVADDPQIAACVPRAIVAVHAVQRARTPASSVQLAAQAPARPRTGWPQISAEAVMGLFDIARGCGTSGWLGGRCCPARNRRLRRRGGPYGAAFVGS